jgi:hypothetical protein
MAITRLQTSEPNLLVRSLAVHMLAPLSHGYSLRASRAENPRQKKAKKNICEATSSSEPQSGVVVLGLVLLHSALFESAFSLTLVWTRRGWATRAAACAGYSLRYRQRPGESTGGTRRSALQVISIYAAHGEDGGARRGSLRTRVSERRISRSEMPADEGARARATCPGTSPRGPSNHRAAPPARAAAARTVGGPRDAPISANLKRPAPTRLGASVGHCAFLGSMRKSARCARAAPNGPVTVRPAAA